MRNGKNDIELAQKVAEYEKMKPGELIDKPDAKIWVGNFSITYRALKHFVERRLEEGSNIAQAVDNLQIAVLAPELVVPNKRDLSGIMLGRKIPDAKKALMVVVTEKGEISSIHFRREKEFDRLKSSMIAVGGAPPSISTGSSSFLSERNSDNLAARLSALQQRSISSSTKSIERSAEAVNLTGIFEIGPERFPPLLREIPDAPKRLFVRGALPAADAVFLCIVGSRNYSSYGKDVCQSLISGLVHEPQLRRNDGSSRIVIISGLALGIDTIAHEAALAAGLPTIALPGSGLEDDVLYPRANHRVAKKILDASGALMSEFIPTWKARPESFPQRNRIMAGISHAILIIEAEKKSGTMITARLATDYNRDVLAIPGSIFSRHTEGPHYLLSQGARLITSAADIIDALDLTPPPEPVIHTKKKKQNSKSNNLELFDTKDSVALTRRFPMATQDELAILAVLIERGNALSKDEVTELANLPISRANVAITLLELHGHIKVTGGLVRLS